jgi:hypothetical protein
MKTLETIPSIDTIHKQFCKTNQKNYFPINIKTDLEWNCFAVSTVLADLLKDKGINARAVYGMWRGYCVEKSMSSDFRHGWVIIDNKIIIDPTRWVFDGVDPKLFRTTTKNIQYDEGMVRFKNQFRTPFPAKEKNERIIDFNWSSNVLNFFRDITGKDCSSLSVRQALWCCNIPYTSHGSLLNEVYLEFQNKGCLSFIPIDYINYWKANSYT